MKILLIAGGWSSEREVSLAGAKGMESALKGLGHEVRFCDLLTDFDRLIALAEEHDFAMLNHATSNPDHQGLGFLVIADDTEREYGNEDKAASTSEEAAAQGWVGISMRDDWSTIYGDGIEKTALPAQERLAEAA